jgi:hypothetical protein
MNVTNRHTKDQIIDAACEIVDGQTSTIERLREQQKILVWIIVILSVGHIIG